MKISITGATGFIGQRLHRYLAQRGYTIIPITRNMLHANNQHQLQKVINSCDAVINLAGESINQRWTPSAKLEIIESRTRTTRSIVSAINRADHPKLLVSASAVGIYPSTNCHNDYSRLRGSSFLTHVCQAWEGEAQRLDPHNSLAITRFGIVLDPAGGALNQMIATSRFGFMPRIGKPYKKITWISREDLIRAISHIIERVDMRGIINICTPKITTQSEFIHATKAHITIPIPESIIRLTHGEAAELILQNQCTIPLRLVTSGFQFNTPTIDEFFASIKE